MKTNGIPIDITIEILSRLPARSVIRFRRVCKLWQSITQDSYFIDTHLNHANKAPSLVLLANTSVRLTITTISDNSRAPNQTYFSGAGYVFLRSSCNGLICIYDCSENENKRIKVLNPATAESVTLPKPRTTLIMPYGNISLGFHPETKEYKVLQFFFPGNDFSIECEVHTLGTSSWRQICIPEQYLHFDFSTTMKGCSTTMKGAMYWRVGSVHLGVNNWVDGKRKVSILSFDLKDEMFTQVSSPDFKIYEGKSIRDCNLIQLQGSVCLPVFVDSQMDIWMMIVNTSDRNNTRHEWVLRYSVILPLEYCWIRPLLIRDDKILIYQTYSDGYCSETDYEPPTLKYHQLNNRVGDIEGTFYHEGKPNDDLKDILGRSPAPFAHVESLVSLRNPCESFELSEKLEPLQASEHNLSYVLTPTDNSVSGQAYPMIKKKEKGKL